MPTWSREALAAAQPARHRDRAAAWLARLERIDPRRRRGRGVARELAALFTAYLRACRADSSALSTLPPGRFLMPGDLDRLAGADLRAARLATTTSGPARLARPHDGAPLRGL